MARTNLLVPFSQKEIVKKLGAKWDAISKTWFIDDDMNQEKFSKWIPKKYKETGSYNVFSPFYYVAQSMNTCYRCKKTSLVYSFLLPEEHMEVEEDDDDKLYLNEAGYFAFISFITRLSKKTAHCLSAISQNYFFDFSNTVQYPYWVNHCPFCKNLAGDFYLHKKPGGAFFHMSEEEAAAVKLLRVDEKFFGRYGVLSVDVPFVESMKLVERL